MLMRHMIEPELRAHLGKQLQFIKQCQTPDTIGSMPIIFQDDGITQYGATIDQSDLLLELSQLFNINRWESRVDLLRQLVDQLLDHYRQKARDLSNND